jgi:hypothetical protein
MIELYKVAGGRERDEKPTMEERRLRATTDEQACEVLEVTDKLIALLEPSETSPVVLEVLKHLRTDIRFVKPRLEENYLKVITVARQADVIPVLEELVRVMKKGRNTNGKAEADRPGEPRLGIDEVSELQLLRALQAAVNKWTEILNRQIDLPDQLYLILTHEQVEAHVRWFQGEFKDLAKRQDRISKLLREVARRTPPARQF